MGFDYTNIKIVILDTFSSEEETIFHVENWLEFNGIHIRRNEIKRFILELIKEELLKICDDPSDGMIEFQNSNDDFIEDYWFDLTPKGRIELNKYGISTNNRIID